MRLSAAPGSQSTDTAPKRCVPGFLCVHALPLPSFLSLFRPVRSVWLPAEHAAAKYTHISKQGPTTDRELSGQRGAGNRSKGEFRERQSGVHTGKQKERGNSEQHRDC